MCAASLILPSSHRMPGAVDVLVEFLSKYKSVAVLTGAGISTDSGIPDYRSPNGSFSRGHKPMKHQEFLLKHSNRQRYWARATVGWPDFNASQPNVGHHALAALEKENFVGGIVTQNVDCLHQKASSENVVNLHGQISEVVCLDCGEKFDRQELQTALSDMNAVWLAELGERRREKEMQLKGMHGGGENTRYTMHHSSNPDGDAELHGMDPRSFKVYNCESCDGILKPNIVFFGDSVPKPRLKTAMSVIEEAPGLLVCGSSLFVWSGFRFVVRAVDMGKKVFCIAP
eukprot:115558_1